MENALRIFNYQGTEIRTIVIDGEVYFVAFDVCRFLELKNVSQAVSRLKEKHKGDIIISDVTGRLQSMLCVKEPGLYQLIFTSWMPEVRRLGLDVSLIRRYPHVYPDKRGKQMANIYPNDWLGTFRTWFQIDYLRHEFPIYLSTRLLALPEGQADQRRLSDGG